MTKGTLIFINNSFICVMSEIPHDMFPWSLGIKIVMQYLTKGISSPIQATELYKSLLGKEYYEDEQRFSDYHQMKTQKEIDDFWVISDYLYVVNNSDIDVSFSNKTFGSFVAEKGKLTITKYYTKLQDMVSVKNFSLRLEDKEIYLLENALDFYFRLYLGQYVNIPFDIRFYCDKTCPSSDFVDPLLLLIRNRVMPNIDLDIKRNINWSYGIGNEKVDIKGRLAYEILKTIMHNRAYAQHPEGGNTVEFNDPLMVSGKSLPKNISKVEDGKVISETSFKAYHLVPILEAVDVYKDYLHLRFVSLFSHFTDDEYAKLFARALTKYFYDEVQPLTSEKAKAVERLENKLLFQLFGINHREE